MSSVCSPQSTQLHPPSGKACDLRPVDESAEAPHEARSSSVSAWGTAEASAGRRRSEETRVGKIIAERWECCGL